MQPLKYLACYSSDIVQQVQSLVDAGTLGQVLLRRYPSLHDIRSDKALYDYSQALKQSYLRQSQPVSKVIFDDKISLSHQALGLHSYVARIQGRKLKAKNEIRISSKLKRVPEPLLKMVVVHELAHLREKEHNKAFYQLCTHMLPDYHQLEFDLRLYLTCVNAAQCPYQAMA
ncbi:M48 family metallopeptidase [Shewanella salipaludis]|uniref:M48 family metallopeptidase n=1 Tax=Shewanella salipaludis TaxID=2723052 RepID=A0A972JLT1_9GAMM|nr:YgjP-like metallopeptidase domain-containing protein [Shewanella salipaludis]NMH64401.1 M48 family metallopeptidase [Shewanella salipaludis]